MSDLHSLNDLLNWWAQAEVGLDLSKPHWEIGPDPNDDYWGAMIISWNVEGVPVPTESQLAQLEEEYINAGWRADYEGAAEDIAYSELTAATSELFARSTAAIELANRLETLFTNENLRTPINVIQAWQRFVAHIKQRELDTANDAEPFVLPAIIIMRWNQMAERRLFPEALRYPDEPS